jgi:FkbM family methyltransferase
LSISARTKQLVKEASGGLPFTIDESWVVFDAFGARPGLMLDVGANIGESLAPFVGEGWSVHAFEPDPANFARLHRAYGDDSHVTLVEKALSSEPGSLPLYTSDESIGISSLTPFTEKHTASSTVEVTTLSDYLAASDITHIDFMKIDVEGFEMQVLEGHDWEYPPDTIVLEFEDAKTKPLGYSWTDLGDLLVEHGYSVVVSEWEPIEKYGIAHNWRRFADYPTPLTDTDAWGNLVATKLDRSQLDRALRRARRRSEFRRMLKRIGL